MADHICLSYAQLYGVLCQMRESLDGGAVAECRRLFTVGRQIFHDQILGADGATITTSSGVSVQALTTEVNKDLRLLNADLMFLSTAQQGQTVQHRAAQVGDRLNRLIHYCEAILDASQHQR